MSDDFDEKRIGAFCSSSHDAARSQNGYLQVDLGQQKTINYIATQGMDFRLDFNCLTVFFFSIQISLKV